MSPAATVEQPLQYFIHHDFDALRMEIAGPLIGMAARKAYEAWRAALAIARQQRLVVDISYVTEADEGGRAVLGAWREHNARIIASSRVSKAIADSIVNAPIRKQFCRRWLRDWLASFLSDASAGTPASAEGTVSASARSKRESTENAGFLAGIQMEQQMRKE